nr:leucine-rich repeat protein [Intestinimonas timonensis]
MREGKRRILSILTALALVLGLCTPLGGLLLEAEAAEIVAQGDTSVQGDIHWELDSEGTFTLSGDGRPPMVSASMQITPWDDYKDQIRRVVIEDGVWNTGEYSFSDCTNLTEVELASSVTTIGDGAFSGCTGLTSIRFPDTLDHIGSGAFSGCTGLTELAFPNSLEDIGSWAFARCTGLTEVVFPAHASVGTQAFTACEGLRKVVLPDKNAVGQSAFAFCTSLTEVYWPLGLTSADQYFHNGSGHLTVYYEGSREDWDNIGVPYLGQKIPEGTTVHYNCETPLRPGNGEEPDSDTGNTPSTQPVPTSFIPTPILDDPTCMEEGVSVSWTLPLVVPGETHTVDGFYILRKTAGGSYQRVGQVGEYTHLYADTSVQEGQTYTYTVQAYYQDRTGDYDQSGKTITWESSPLSISEVNISGGYPMLPLQGKSEVLLTLKEPLPERYLEGGTFTGSVRLVAGDRLLANGTEVAYEPEYMDLYATFSPGAGGHFPPNTEAEIQVLNAEGRVIGRAPCKTYFQQWAVANFSSSDAPVPERLIYLMLWGENSDGWGYETRADQLVGRGAQPGKGGFCFGMALAVSLVNWFGTYDFGAYDILDETGDTVQKLAQVDMEGEFTGINAVEFIQLCHIAQYLWPIQDALDENKWDYSGLLKEIDRYKAGECPMPIAWISATDSKTKDKSSHALGAYDYRLDGGDAYILCYDCNLPGVRKELKLSNYKDSGSAAWSFETLGWQGSQQGNSDNYFTYYTPDKDNDIFIYAEQSDSAVLLSASDQNTLKQVEVTSGLKLTTISYLASSYLTADADPFSGGMAWLTGKGTLTLPEATGETTLADGAAVYSVKGAGGWSSELSEGTVTQLSAQGEGITLSCTYYTEDGDRVEVSFAGDAGNNGKDVSMSRTGDTVRFSGGESGTVTVTYENGKTWTEQVEPGKDLSVTADGKNEPSTNGAISQVPDSVRFFDDISPDDYFYDAVVWAVEHGVTTGTGPNTFSPYRPCTRAEVVTLLWRALGLDEGSVRSTDNPFADVDDGDYFRDAVLWAAEYGITTGTDERHFSPDKSCTRAEVVTFLWRSHFPMEVVMDEGSFRDVNAWDYYALPVNWAVKEGITTGTGEGTFSPNMVCTRSQVVTFLYRYFGN